MPIRRHCLILGRIAIGNHHFMTGLILKSDYAIHAIGFGGMSMAIHFISNAEIHGRSARLDVEITRIDSKIRSHLFAQYAGLAGFLTRSVQDLAFEFRCRIFDGANALGREEHRYLGIHSLGAFPQIGNLPICLTKGQ